MPFCIGLTGGIGSGKSSAARLFAELGAGVVDTDEISHELTRAGGAAIAAIRQAFGTEFITPEGALDRSRMRERVFHDAAARAQLESILHPLIGTEARRRIATPSAPYVLIVVPLLLETGAYRDLVKRVLVVDCSEAQQIARTMQRSGLAESQVRAIMAAQIPRAQRLAQADDVISNDTDAAALRAQVRQLDRRYRDLATARRRPETGGGERR